MTSRNIQSSFKSILVDFDGAIGALPADHKGPHYIKDMVVTEGAVAAFNRLVDVGYDVFVLMFGSDERKKESREWMIKQGFKNNFNITDEYLVHPIVYLRKPMQNLGIEIGWEQVVRSATHVVPLMQCDQCGEYRNRRHMHQHYVPDKTRVPGRGGPEFQDFGETKSFCDNTCMVKWIGASDPVAAAYTNIQQVVIKQRGAM